LTIEEQLAALEARIQQCMIAVAGATDIAELAAQRSEAAAARAELAALGSQQAEVASVVAAEVATVEATVAIEAVVEVQEIAEQVEEAEVEEEEPEVSVPERPLGEAGTEPGLPGEPIIIHIEEHKPAEPTLFKPNRTSFNRGRKS